MWLISLAVLFLFPRDVLAVPNSCGKVCGNSCVSLSDVCRDETNSNGTCQDVNGQCTFVATGGDVMVTLAPTMAPTAIPTIGPQTCSRCSTVFNNMRVSYVTSGECAGVPPAGAVITRKFDSSCQVGQPKCQRCSTTNPGEYVWWEGDCNLPQNYTVYRDGGNFEKCPSISDPVSTTSTPTMQYCSRCSIFYENQKTEWQAVDCNVSPTTNVTRTFDATCVPPASTKKINCQRCSTINQREYVWWEPEAGKTCNDPVTTAVTRAVRDDCAVVTRLCRACNGKYDHNLGNSDCDDDIGMDDFEIWKSEKLSGIVSDGDFDCDGFATFSDFEIWKASKLNSENLPTRSVTPVPTNVPQATPTPICRVDGAVCMRDNGDYGLCAGGSCVPDNGPRPTDTGEEACVSPQTNPHSVEEPLYSNTCVVKQGCGYNDQVCL